jgi:hypothetical protein
MGRDNWGHHRARLEQASSTGRDSLTGRDKWELEETWDDRKGPGRLEEGGTIGRGEDWGGGAGDGEC